MGKEVTCSNAQMKPKEWIDGSEDREGEFVFSIADSSSIPGKPRQQYKLRVKITEELQRNWGLAQSSDDDDPVLKRILFYYATEHVRQKLEATRNDPLPERDELILTTAKCTEDRCPVRISEIQEVKGFTFTVDMEAWEDERANQSLAECLEDFANYVQSEKRMTFWRSGDCNDRRWTARPEEHAKNLLHTFLRGRFGNSAYTFEEITAGAGKVDLFVVPPDRKNAVVELKMCGKPYSKAYAQEGKEQLLHYMKSKDARTGYLLVFDSRRRDFACGFTRSETISGMLLATLVVDVRPYVKQKGTGKNT